jgi:LPS export ABC transporter protein LptC
MKKIPIIMWPIGGIFFLLLIAAFFVCKVPQLCMDASTASNLSSGESLKMCEISYNQDYKNGEGKWELKAKEGYFRNKTQTLTLKDVLLKLSPAQDTAFTIQGNEGDYYRERGEIIFRGEVTGRSADGYQIETSLLIYSEKDESVATDRSIKVIGPFFHVKGDSLFVDLARNTFTVRGNVCTTLNSGVWWR